MRRLLPLLIVSLTLGFSLGSPAGAEQMGERVALPVAEPPKVSCARPESLRLRRFEDGSAWLRCGGRTLARVTVPG